MSGRSWARRTIAEWQLNGLLDQTNYDKSVARLVALLQALDCEVALTVRARPA